MSWFIKRQILLQTLEGRIFSEIIQDLINFKEHLDKNRQYFEEPIGILLYEYVNKNPHIFQDLSFIQTTKLIKKAINSLNDEKIKINYRKKTITINKNTKKENYTKTKIRLEEFQTIFLEEEKYRRKWKTPTQQKFKP